MLKDFLNVKMMSPPPLYLLMVAGESQMIFSNLVEETEKTAIVVNFDEGKELVLKFLELVAIYEEYYQIDSFKEFVRETKEFLNQRKPNYVVLENFEIVDVSYEIKREVEELYAKHLSGNLSSEFNNDFDDTSIEWGEIDREDIGWNDFRSENLYFEL